MTMKHQNETKFNFIKPSFFKTRLERINLQHFVISFNRNEQLGGNHYGKGKEPEVKGTGSVRFRTPSPPSPLLKNCLTLQDVVV